MELWLRGARSANRSASMTNSGSPLWCGPEVKGGAQKAVTFDSNWPRYRGKKKRKIVQNKNLETCGNFSTFYPWVIFTFWWPREAKFHKLRALVPSVADCVRKAFSSTALSVTTVGELNKDALAARLFIFLKKRKMKSRPLSFIRFSRKFSVPAQVHWRLQLKNLITNQWNIETEPNLLFK